jgi:hypothetical protein
MLYEDEVEVLDEDEDEDALGEGLILLKIFPYVAVSSRPEVARAAVLRTYEKKQENG